MSKRKLLLADDSVTIQKVVNLTFADEGIEVISVGDGDSAMDKVAEISPDLVMADVNMPGLTGYEICERIRQDEALRHTPVILLVGSFEPFDEDEARRVGADDFLTKPFQSIRQLVNKVTVLLNSGSSQNGEVAPPAVKEVSSFDDTLEMEKPEEDNSFEDTIRYDNTGYDDEMIQSKQVAGFAFDESQKFETKETPDFAQTQPLTTQEIKGFDLVGQPSIAAETIENNEIESNEIEAESEMEVSQSELNESIQDDEMPLPEVASILESDDDDILQLPPIESDYEDEDEEEPPVTEASSENLAETSPVETSEETGSLINSSQISPELIEAIANRVVEKLSEKAVKEVAWEVVPQMTELIVTKMAEEKLKE